MSIGAVIENSPHEHSFVNARNQSFQAIGTTRLVISVADNSHQHSLERKWTCYSAVVKHLAAPLVLGSHFMRTTETFTSLAHLLVKKTMSISHDHLHGLKRVWRFMHMDLLTQELGCYLDDKFVFAALDSGSAIDVVSLGYAKSRKWQVKLLPEGEGYVQLANDELVKLTGYVETTFEYAGECRISKRFYVLDGLACDVVLGDPTLEALDIFNTAASSIIDRSESEELGDFRMIQWIEEIDKIGQDAESILAGSDNPTARGGWSKVWSSVFDMKSKKKDNPVDRTGMSIHNF